MLNPIFTILSLAVISRYNKFINTFGSQSISYGICFDMLVGMAIGMMIEKK